MSRVFKPFLEKAVDFITEQCSVKNLKKLKDLRAYLTSLLALLSQIASPKLPIEVQRRSLEHTIKVLKSASKLPSDLTLMT